MNFLAATNAHNNIIQRAIEINTVVNDRIKEYFDKYGIDEDEPISLYPYEFSFDVAGYLLSAIQISMSYTSTMAMIVANVDGYTYRLTVPYKYFDMTNLDILRDIDKHIEQAVKFKLDIINRDKKDKDNEEYRKYMNLKRKYEDY